MAVAEPDGVLLLPAEEIAQREREELQVAVSALKAQKGADHKIQALLQAKLQLCSTRAELQRRLQEEEAAKLQAAQARTIAALECDLAKSKVDLHRWRQRTALLKVRLSSAQEDVDRYQRMSRLLVRQLELELAAKRGLAADGAALRDRLAVLQRSMAGQAEALAQLQAEARQLQDVVSNRDDQLARMQRNLELSGEEQAAALAGEQAKCLRLHEQLVAVEERARLTEATLAAEQSRAAAAEHALQQERAMFAANQTLHTGLTSMAQMMDANVQAQLTAAQEALRQKERRERELEQRCERLEGKLERKARHLASLQAAMQQPDDGTPARGVAAALNSVGALAEQLGELTPESELKLHRPVLSQPKPAAPAADVFEFAPEAAKPKAGSKGSGKTATAPAAKPAPAAAAKPKPAGNGKAAQAEAAPAERRQQSKGQRQAPKPAPKPAVKPAARKESGDDWSDGDSQRDEDFCPAAKLAAKPARSGDGQRKQKAQQQKPKKAAKAAAAKAIAVPAPVAAASGRPTRQRSNKVPYWMGSSAAAADPTSPASATEDEEAAVEDVEDEEALRQAETEAVLALGQLDLSKKERKPQQKEAGTQQQTKKARKAAAGAEEAAEAEEEAGPSKQAPTPTSGRKRKQPEQAALVVAEEDGVAEAEEQEEQHPAAKKGGKKGSGGGGARKRPAKRPTNTTKYDLTQVWGGDTPSSQYHGAGGGKEAATGGMSKKKTAGAKSRLGQVARAGGSPSENMASRQQQQQQQQQFRSKLEDKPLEALNKNVLVAAERYAAPRLGAASFKAGLQQAVAKRSLGGSSSQEQGGGSGTGGAAPGKRRLLGVSTSFAVAGDALPAHALFGNAFKVPKLAGKGGDK